MKRKSNLRKGRSARWVFIWIVLVLTGQAKAQTATGQDVIGNWVMYFGQNRIADNWSIHSEFQWRNHAINPNLEQTLSRAGLNYHFNSNFMLTGGYGYITTHPFDKSVSDITSREHRIWQQFVMKNRLGRLHFVHRYRYEQRWVNNVFRQRGRYFLRVLLPLNSREMEKGSIFLTAYDEIFININRGNAFDRNRLYGAIGYQVYKSTNVQLGFLQQTVPAFAKGYMQIAVFFNPDLRR